MRRWRALPSAVAALRERRRRRFALGVGLCMALALLAWLVVSETSAGWGVGSRPTPPAPESETIPGAAGLEPDSDAARPGPGGNEHNRRAGSAGDAGGVVLGTKGRSGATLGSSAGPRPAGDGASPHAHDAPDPPPSGGGSGPPPGVGVETRVGLEVSAGEALNLEAEVSLDLVAGDGAAVDADVDVNLEATVPDVHVMDGLVPADFEAALPSGALEEVGPAPEAPAGEPGGWLGGGAVPAAIDPASPQANSPPGTDAVGGLPASGEMAPGTGMDRGPGAAPQPGAPSIEPATGGLPDLPDVAP